MEKERTKQWTALMLGKRGRPKPKAQAGSATTVKDAIIWTCPGTIGTGALPATTVHFCVCHVQIQRHIARSPSISVSAGLCVIWIAMEL